MTTKQLTKILGADELNKWTTLENKFMYIQLISEKKIFNVDNGKSRQIYFDTTNNIMYVRYTDGHPIKVDPSKPLSENEVIVYNRNTPFKMKLLGSGIKNKKLGKYHEAFFFTEIASLTK